jgi:DNA-binding LacI/PurR family transcriptional regulator
MAAQTLRALHDSRREFLDTRGIYAEAERLDYEVLLSATGPGRGEAKAVEALRSHRCEAAILLGPGASDADLDALGQGAAMRRHGLEPELRVIPGNHAEQSGIDAGRLLLAERDGGQVVPTAVLAGNDRSAMGLLMALTRSGIEVPRDLSVVGYDDSHLSHLMPIGLTTLRQDAVLMAEFAVRFAVERLENRELEPRAAVLEASAATTAPMTVRMPVTGTGVWTPFMNAV